VVPSCLMVVGWMPGGAVDWRVGGSTMGMAPFVFMVVVVVGGGSSPGCLSVTISISCLPSVTYWAGSGREIHTESLSSSSGS
jgi:hypothetical protein